MLSEYFQEVADCLIGINQAEIQCALEMLNESSLKGRKILIAGNGGSAAIAAHFAVDLIKSGHLRNDSIKAIALSDNAALITATANDFSFEDIFSWQIHELGESEDLLFVISSSGNSMNILNALDVAKKLGIKSISITGFDGGEASKKSDLALVTKSDLGNYGPVEDSHSILCHYISRKILSFPN